MLYSKARTRLFKGTIFVAAMLFAPCALAQGYGTQHAGSYHHRHFAGRHQTGLSSRHRLHRTFAIKDSARATAWRHERVNGEGRQERGRLYHANFAAVEARRGVADQAAVEARRERTAADEREDAVTANLNLAQLRTGQERDAAIAHWKLEYGGAASG